jgi:ribose transport system substrate-binding protein
MTSQPGSATALRAHRHRRRAALAIVATLGLLAACGSDDNGSSGTSAAAATTAAAAGGAATTAGGGAATTAGGGAATTAAASGGSGGVAEAQAATEKNLQEPTAIPLTEPLKEKPAAGKFVWMQCDVNQCKDIGDGLKAATEAIGWDYKSYTYQSADPATLVAAMKQALQDDPTAVGVTGLPPAVWQNVIADYKAAGVPIVTGYIGDQEYDDTLIGQVGGSPDVKAYADMIANWVVADSDGSAKVLLQSVNDFPILKVFSDEYKAKTEELCPDCDVTEINNTIAQLGTAVVPSIVAAVQKDPSIKYVVTVNGPFVTGLRSALDAAGLSDVKIAGESGDVTNLTNVKAGKESAFTALALHYGAWAMVDMVLRHMQGIDFDPDGDGGLPKQLLTKDVDFEIANSYDKPADYADQFKKLWLVA